MAQKKEFHLRTGVVRVTRTHFLFVLLLSFQIMMYDAWKLINPDTVRYRWLLTMGLLAVNGVIWYLARGTVRSLVVYKLLAFALIAADIAAISANVYLQRGMASAAVMLYAIPLLVASMLLSRSAIFLTAILCIAAYVSTAISYFVLNFNEGFKVQLYGEVGFYSFLILILAEMLWTTVRSKQSHD